MLGEGMMMKNSVAPRVLEIKDIRVLQYVSRKEQVKKEELIKKFGEYRIQILSEHTQENPSLIFEKFEDTEKEAPWPPGWGPPTNIERKYLGIYKLTLEGINALENANAQNRREWIKFYIPIAISILALIISLLSLLYSE